MTMTIETSSVTGLMKLQARVAYAGVKRDEADEIRQACEAIWGHVLILMNTPEYHEYSPYSELVCMVSQTCSKMIRELNRAPDGDQTHLLESVHVMLSDIDILHEKVGGDL